MKGESKRCEFLARESVSSSPIVRLFGKGKCKFIANFSATMVTSLSSLSLSVCLYLSLSLSLSPKVPHAQYRKRFRASYNTEREREREIDGSDVTIVALKLAMNLHFPLPKIHTIGDELTLSLAKIRTFRFSFHTSRLFLQGEVTMVALKFALSSHFPLPKICSPSGFVSPLSNGTSRATSDRKPKTNDQILPSPILFFPSKN